MQAVLPFVSHSGSWAKAMTFRERTLEEAQAGRQRMGGVWPCLASKARRPACRGMAEC